MKWLLVGGGVALRALGPLAAGLAVPTGTAADRRPTRPLPRGTVKGRIAGASRRKLRQVWKRFDILSSLESGEDTLHSAPVRYDGGVWVATLHAGVDLTPGNLAHDVRVALRPELRLDTQQGYSEGRKEGMNDTKTYTVPGIHCGHCAQAIKDGVSGVEGVKAVDVDVEAKVVTIQGEALSDAALRVAIDEAGYEAA